MRTSLITPGSVAVCSYDAEVRVDTEARELVEVCDELPPEWKLRLAELKLMELSSAAPEEASGGPSSMAILDRTPGCERASRILADGDRNDVAEDEQRCGPGGDPGSSGSPESQRHGAESDVGNEANDLGEQPRRRRRGQSQRIGERHRGRQ